MRRALPLASALVLLAACGGAQKREYSQSDLQLLPTFTAKSYCSCLYVMEMGEEYCKEWSRQSPPLARISVDQQKREVTVSALMLWASKARWIDEKRGCELVE